MKVSEILIQIVLTAIAYIVIGSVVWFFANIFGAKWGYWEAIRISLFVGTIIEIFGIVIKSTSKFDATDISGIYRP